MAHSKGQYKKVGRPSAARKKAAVASHRSRRKKK